MELSSESRKRLAEHVTESYELCTNTNNGSWAIRETFEIFDIKD